MMTDTPMPERQEHAIELQWEIAALPSSAAFHQSFIPHGHVVDLLVKIAVSDSRFAADARTEFEEWRNGLATPEQIPNHELEVGGGAVVSEADEGWVIARGDLVPLDPKGWTFEKLMRANAGGSVARPQIAAKSCGRSIARCARTSTTW